MFFESTYLSSPQFSPISPDDSAFNDNFSLEEGNSQYSQTEDKEEEPPVNHLVFIIHGIGQQTEQYGHFYEHVANLKETTRQVLQAKIPDHNVRIELVPIEWHRHLHDRVDHQFRRITLKSIPTIRLIENEYLADVLLYFSKDHGQAIIDNVTELFNTSYHNFMKKHPNFNGKIVILGYSLGGIVTWDILSHQREPITEDEKADYQKLNIKYSQLDFKPNYFFTLGSPIAAVLTIRNQSPVNYHPADSVTFENIYDSYDPLAYRLEPLYDDYFIDHPAVPIERSMPSSVPSFSFPSLPSLPASSLFSFFSWKMTTSASTSNNNTSNVESDTSTIGNVNTDQTTITNEGKEEESNDNYSISKDDHIIPTNIPTNVSNASENEEETPNSIPTAGRKKSVMSSVLQYFGKKNENSNRSSNNPSPSASSTALSSSSNKQQQKQKQQQLKKIKKEDDIIKWDPLHEQVLSSSNSLQLLASCSIQSTTENQQANKNKNNKDNNDTARDGNDGNNTDDADDNDDKTISLNASTHRLPLQRSITYSDQRSLQNLLDNNNNNEEKYTTTTARSANTTPTIHPYNKTMVHSPSLEKEKAKQERHHLVEVLGIDGVRIDSIERANANFQRQQQYNKPNTLSSTDKKSHDNNNEPTTTAIAFMDFNEYTQQQQTGMNNNNNNNESIANPQEQTQKKDDEEEDESNNNNNNNNVDDNNVDDDDDNVDDDDSQTEQHTLEKLPGQKRIDYTLQQEGFMSMIANEYLVGLRAHFSYWASKDLLWHIVRRLENLDINTTTSSTPTINMSNHGSSDSIPTQLENSK